MTYHSYTLCCLTFNFNQSQDIAVDDFPALATLYAGALSARGAQRASSGEVGEDSSTPDARVDKSLVMKVDHMAVTAQLWSLTPWSRVRRYDKVHVKGITLRLRQVNGILNFSFLALRKSPGYDSGRSANASSDSSRVVLNRADSASGDGTTSNSAMRSGGMEELDGIEVAGAAALTDNEEDASTLSSEEEFAAPGQQVAVHQHGNSREHDSLADETADAPNSPRDSITTTNTWGGASAGSTASNGRLAGILARKNRRIFAPRTSSLKGSHVTTRANGRIGDVHPAHRKSSSARDAEGGMSPPPGALSAARNRRIKRPAFVPFSGRNHLGAEGSANGSRAATPAAVGTSSGSSETPAENRGNMGVVKVLGEAFMRRFNAYAEQVGGCACEGASCSIDVMRVRLSMPFGAGLFFCCSGSFFHECAQPICGLRGVCGSTRQLAHGVLMLRTLLFGAHSGIKALVSLLYAVPFTARYPKWARLFRRSST